MRKLASQIAIDEPAEWANPTIIEIDSVTITGGATALGPYTFDASVPPMSVSRRIVGSTLTYREQGLTSCGPPSVQSSIRHAFLS
ncbi:MAG TPA: hypothetical protein VFQ61_37095 [Polyangiaceae bacterium]|nr:hypothetical protein [Polyangiaceae bacterium]